MAMKPKKSDLKLTGAGDPNYIKDMMARGKKKRPAMLPNPNGDKLISRKPSDRELLPKKSKATTKKELLPKRVIKSEKMLKDKVKSGKVKDLNAARKKISKKTGSWPNGMTN
jgi:hypothetical protein